MRLIIEFGYDGKYYSGYQKQNNKETVQGELEWALTSFFDTPITITASGRTDAGVSAICQVAHFDIDDEVLLTKVSKVNDREITSIATRVNYLLSDNIKISSIKVVDDKFHARFNAKLKTYCYNFYLSKTMNPYLSQFALWLKETNIDIDKIKEGLKYIIGEHNFSAFCASSTDVCNKVRTITQALISYNELGFYTISITGNGFLYNMVRIIVGTIIDVGRGKIIPSEVREIIKSEDRTKAGKTVSSCGLVLKSVVY